MRISDWSSDVCSSNLQRYISDIAGMNSRLDPLQAAILRTKLTSLDRDTARRQAVAARYTEGLAGLAGLALPAVRDGAVPAWHQYVIEAGARDRKSTRLNSSH